MRPGVRRSLQRLGLAVAALAAVLLATAGVLYWRAGRVPAWYAGARQIADDSPEADVAFNRRLTPLQNWAARTSAGDLDAKPAAEKEATLTLTERQINALLAKGHDLVPGRFGGYRVRLTPGTIDVACEANDWERVLGVTVDTTPTDAVPAVRLGGVRVGEQAVPLALVTAGPIGQVRAMLDDPARRGKAFRIDAHDLASGRTAGAYYGRLLLDLLEGRTVSPLAFLPGSPGGDDWVATRVTKLDVSAGSLAVTFRVLDPGERAAVLAALDKPLP